MVVALKSVQQRAKLGLAVLVSALSMSAGCAARRGQAPVQAPLYARTQVTTPSLVVLAPPAAQPRVIIPAPPPAGQAQATTSTNAPDDAAPRAPAPLAPFTPQESPLLAHFDSRPHGETPKVEPEFAARSRPSGWQIATYPGYYGYSPYAGGYYGYSPYGGGYYGYPRVGLGLGVGLGFGLGYGFARPWYGGYHGGYHVHGHSVGGHAYVSGGHAGRHH